MIIKRVNLQKIFNEYKQGALNLLRNKAVKSFDGKIFSLNQDFSVKEKFDIAELTFVDFENLIEDKEKLYLPFVDSFDSFVTCVNGLDFDLDEGLEPEWLEGIGYIQSNERLVDIGELTVAFNNIPGFILWRDNDFNLLFGQYFKNETYCIVLDNIGFLKDDILNF
ncbi:MAG: hypothetical protein ACRCYE_01280, partial [Sarcina sp.]